MNLKYEKMLFYNDLLQYQCSDQGKELDYAFSHEKDIKKLETIIDNYYSARNSDKLTYSDLKELEEAKETDNYIARLYCEQN